MQLDIAQTLHWEVRRLKIDRRLTRLHHTFAIFHSNEQLCQETCRKGQACSACVITEAQSNALNTHSDACAHFKVERHHSAEVRPYHAPIRLYDKCHVDHWQKHRLVNSCQTHVTNVLIGILCFHHKLCHEGFFLACPCSLDFINRNVFM